VQQLRALALGSMLPLLLGCSARGVSVGSEELCQPDRELAAAAVASDVTVSTCATLGENELEDAGFEAPLCMNDAPCQLSASDVPAWSTTSITPVIELWVDGQDGVPADAGQQFAELDATSQDTLSQELALTPGQLMYWAFSHRGRDGIDSLELRIGPPGKLRSQGIFSAPDDEWRRNRGLYRVGAGETTTQFALVSRSGTTRGNFVDDVIFAVVDEF
jgi:hypothetical protein